jgi:hypothetical protein
MQNVLTKAALGLSIIAGSVALARPASATNTFYEWQNHKNTNFCLGVAAGNVTNGTHLIVWQCNGNSDQAWSEDLSDELSFGSESYFSFRDGTNYNKCLGVPAGSHNQGVGLVIWDCVTPRSSHPDQFWAPLIDYTTGCYKFLNANSGMYMAVGNNGDVENGTQVVQWPSTPTADQEWCPVEVGLGQ